MIMAATKKLPERLHSFSGDISSDLPLPSPSTPTGTSAQRSTALSNKLASVLSASYADLGIRDALGILDDRKLQNTTVTRRQLRLDVQREIIECNGEIIREFGDVADVSGPLMSHHERELLIRILATETHWFVDSQLAKVL